MHQWTKVPSQVIRQRAAYQDSKILDNNCSIPTIYHTGKKKTVATHRHQQRLNGKHRLPYTQGSHKALQQPQGYGRERQARTWVSVPTSSSKLLPPWCQCRPVGSLNFHLPLVVRRWFQQGLLENLVLHCHPVVAKPPRWPNRRTYGEPELIAPSRNNKE